AGEAVAPRLLHRPRDADPRADDERRLCLAREELERRLVERQTVLAPGQSEPLAELAGTGTERSFRLEPTPLAHRLEAARRLERPHEGRLRPPFIAADEVEAPVDAVGAIDVRVAGRPEHRRRTGGEPA